MSQILPLMFFSSENGLFSWTDLLKRTSWRTKILIFPVWNKILKIWDTLFELIQIEVKCSKNHFKTFLPREAGASGNNKNHAQNWKKHLLHFYREYLLCLQSTASGSFLQTCINFVEQWRKFSHFEGSIIP